MKHLNPVSRPIPLKAYYYNISLTQKLGELVTIVSIAESIKNMIVSLFPGS